MARYSSRPRRSSRRPYYRKKNPNRLGQVVVVALVLVAVAVFVVKRYDRGADPNTVDPTDFNDVVNNMMDRSGGTEPRSVMDLPGTGNASSGTTEDANTVSPVVPPKVVDMNAGANPEVRTLVAQAMSAYQSDSSRMVQVRDVLNKALRDMSMSPMQRLGIMDEMSKLAEIWLFGRTAYSDDPLCDMYMVQSGDNLERIGKNNDVPYQVLMQINGIRKASALRADANIKVINGPFRAVVKRSAFTLDLYLQDTYVKTYEVGLGRPGRETPTGEWMVAKRLERPTYWDPDTGEKFVATDPEYPIGPRYIELKGLSGEAVGRTGFAIHGTNKPQEIGMNTSSGCIRMRDNEVLEIFGLLAENKSQVLVQP